VNPDAPTPHATVHPIDAKAATYALVEAATTAGYAPSIQGDKPHDWLRAGEALSAAWLTATEHGDSVLPLCAPAQMLSTRQALQRMVAGIAYPFLMLRLGVIDPADPGLPHAALLPAGQTIERP